jgi:DNA-binding NtrC family response regulator
MRKDIRSIPSETMARMTRMPWPGNIRELQNVVERAVILTDGETLQVMLPPEQDSTAAASHPLTQEAVAAASAASAVKKPASPSTLKLEEIERKALLEALRQAKGRISGPNGAAAILGLKRTTFHSKMRRLGVDRSELWQD